MCVLHVVEVSLTPGDPMNERCPPCPVSAPVDNTYSFQRATDYYSSTGSLFRRTSYWEFHFVLKNKFQKASIRWRQQVHANTSGQTSDTCKEGTIMWNSPDAAPIYGQFSQRRQCFKGKSGISNVNWYLIFSNDPFTPKSQVQENKHVVTAYCVTPPKGPGTSFL